MSSLRLFKTYKIQSIPSIIPYLAYVHRRIPTKGISIATIVMENSTIHSITHDLHYSISSHINKNAFLVYANRNNHSFLTLHQKD